MLYGRLSNGYGFIGVDQENIKRLTDGQPILMDLGKIENPKKVVIYYGETLDDILNDLEKRGYLLGDIDDIRQHIHKGDSTNDH
jgi:hypothetical protein